MDYIDFFIDFILHIDKHLDVIVTDYQTWTYLFLFVVVFCETGLVVTPFLPGDSLLFAAGTIAARPDNPLEIKLVILTFFAAALIGDNVNYWIGRLLGQKVYEKNYKLIRREYLDKTHAFYEKHGGKTIIIARYMPIIRTFAPFVAGVGTMLYRKFFGFSLLGNILWTVSFCLAGFFFGNIPFIQKNFTIVILVIIFISLLPMIIALVKSRLNKVKSK